MAPWLPDHEASQTELPEEVSALRGLAAVMHSKCMASDQFMAAIQQEAARMTARQAEQLQVSYFCTNDVAACACCARMMPCHAHSCFARTTAVRIHKFQSSGIYSLLCGIIRCVVEA